jgi:acyl-CoA dehydrogenase
VVAGQAATVAAAASHQAHGAMGMTREYELGQLTRRLWSWRDEYGSERYWSRTLGRQLIDAGADGLWPAIAVGARS